MDELDWKKFCLFWIKFLSNAELFYLDSAAKLFKLRRNINIMISPLFFEDKDDPSVFLGQIMEEGEVIYTKV